MSLSVHEILAPLDPHWDRIVRSPLSADEVDDLGRQVGLRVPAVLREYLMEVGLFQDLTWGASAIEVYDSTSRFVSAREFLSTLLPPKHADLFPFGGDGAGNEFCLSAAEGASGRTYFVDHERAKVSPRKEFTEWLQAVVAKTLRGIRRRPPNERKVWSVEFTLPAISFAQLSSLVGSVGAVSEIDSDWTNATTSEAGVTSSERSFELDRERIRVTLMDYPGWKAPLLSFNMREPLGAGLEHSRIRALNTLFKGEVPGYRLVDYGALDGRELEKADRRGAS
jgi:hypothetical protein